MTKIVCVLKSGGEYDSSHVHRLKRQCDIYANGIDFLCLTDMAVDCCDSIPFELDLRGWFSKMCLCQPSLTGDLLYMDLDTTIIGDISHMFDSPDPIMLRDFYFPDRLASGLMFLPECDRAPVWHDFCSSAETWMKQAGKKGDGWVFEQLLPYASTWQYEYPDQVFSYKADIRVSQCDREHGTGHVPADARIICYHGKPRPWDIDERKLYGSAFI